MRFPKISWDIWVGKMEEAMSKVPWPDKMTGRIVKLNRFENVQSQPGYDAIVAAIESPEIVQLRNQLADELEKVGISIDKTHKDYLPHITLMRIPHNEPSPIEEFKEQEIEFDGLEIWDPEDRHEISLHKENDSTQWFEKQRVAHHDHEGQMPEHPVAVKDHQKWFSNIERNESDREGIDDLIFNVGRQYLAEEVDRAIEYLSRHPLLKGKIIGVEVIGSFLSSKEDPKDIDLFWEFADTESMIFFAKKVVPTIKYSFSHVEHGFWTKEHATSVETRDIYIAETKKRYKVGPRRLDMNVSLRRADAAEEERRMR